MMAAVHHRHAAPAASAASRSKQHRPRRLFRRRGRLADHGTATAV